MAQKAEFIKIPPTQNGLPQTTPTEPERRLPNSDISISKGGAEDIPDIIAGLYASFPQKFWDRKEPVHLRPPTDAMRRERFVKRTLPTLSNPHLHWLVARHAPTGEIMGGAQWLAPGNPIHNVNSKSAVDFYGWRDQYDCSDEEFEELWSTFDRNQWDGQFAEEDKLRKEVMGEEPHWFLGSLFTCPGWQGRGVAKLLLNWAIEQADATDPVTPMYLESSDMARAVYMHCGFVPQGAHNFVRRGPAIVKGLE